MYTSDLEQRRNRILTSVIESYITTAAPVGSQFIAQKMRPAMSPATIRNVMVELEQAGFLRQPHTSAGRVPTERGYRFYVDALMEVRRLTPEQIRQIYGLVRPEVGDGIEQLYARAMRVLAELTQEAAFVVAPTVKRSTVRQIELVPLGVRRVLCVMVADDEMFASHVVEIAEPISRDEALALVRFFNTELVGLPFGALLDQLERRLLAQNDSFYHLVKRSLSILQNALATEPDDRLYIEGTSYVIAKPEFRKDPENAHRLVRALEAEGDLLAHLREDLRAGRMRIRIGHELQVSGCERCSYAAAPFVIGGRVVGGVGVLGPTRMDYPKITAYVDAMAACLSEILRRLEEHG